MINSPETEREEDFSSEISYSDEGKETGVATKLGDASSAVPYFLRLKKKDS